MGMSRTGLCAGAWVVLTGTLILAGLSAPAAQIALPAGTWGELAALPIVALNDACLEAASGDAAGLAALETKWQGLQRLSTELRVEQEGIRDNRAAEVKRLKGLLDDKTRALRMFDWTRTPSPDVDERDKIARRERLKFDTWEETYVLGQISRLSNYSVLDSDRKRHAEKLAAAEAALIRMRLRDGGSHTWAAQLARVNDEIETLQARRAASGPARVVALEGEIRLLEGEVESAQWDLDEARHNLGMTRAFWAIIKGMLPHIENCIGERRQQLAAAAAPTPGAATPLPQPRAPGPTAQAPRADFATTFFMTRFGWDSGMSSARPLAPYLGGLFFHPDGTVTGWVQSAGQLNGTWRGSAASGTIALNGGHSGEWRLTGLVFGSDARGGPIATAGQGAWCAGRVKSLHYFGGMIPTPTNLPGSDGRPQPGAIPPPTDAEAMCSNTLTGGR